MTWAGIALIFSFFSSLSFKAHMKGLFASVASYYDLERTAFKVTLSLWKRIFILVKVWEQKPWSRIIIASIRLMSKSCVERWFFKRGFLCDIIFFFCSPHIENYWLYWQQQQLWMQQQRQVQNVILIISAPVTQKPAATELSEREEEELSEVM